MTTNEMARKLNCKRTTILKYCLKLGFKKSGRDYYLTENELMEIKVAMKIAHPGRRW